MDRCKGSVMDSWASGPDGIAYPGGNTVKKNSSVMVRRDRERASEDIVSRVYKNKVNILQNQ